LSHPHIRSDQPEAPAFYETQTVRVRVSQSQNLGETMKNIRVWLDHHKIHPASFRTTADATGYLLSIDFRSKETAEQFRRQFAAAVTPQPAQAEPAA
jgi:hypothetical protein